MKLEKLIDIKKIMKLIIIMIFINGIYILLNRSYKSLNEYIINIYGYVDIWNLNIASIIKWIFINSISLFYLGNYIEINLIKNVTILFTRTNKRGNILLKYIFRLFLFVLILNLIQFIILALYCYIFGYLFKIDTNTILFFVRITLYNYLMVLFVNCFSIFTKSIYALYSALLINIGMIYISGMFIEINPGLIKLIPISTCLVSLREINLDLGNIFSMLYIIVLIITIILIVIKLIQKKEFMV